MHYILHTTIVLIYRTDRRHLWVLTHVSMRHTVCTEDQGRLHLPLPSQTQPPQSSYNIHYLVELFYTLTLKATKLLVHLRPYLLQHQRIWQT
jgi:hypothetical protein